MSNDDSGIWGHSSTLGQQSFFMITYRNKREANAIRKYMDNHGMRYKPFTGMEKGVKPGVWHADVSFLVPSEFAATMAEHMVLPKDVMLVGACDARDRRPAIHHDRNTGDMTPIGWFRSVTKERAEEVGAYCFGADGVHFVLEAQDAPGRLHTCPG